MGKPNSKEAQEVIIAQNAAGGENSASIEQLKYHASNTNLLLIGICVILTAVGVIYCMRHYRKCHGNWIAREINENELRRSMSLMRRREGKIQEIV